MESPFLESETSGRGPRAAPGSAGELANASDASPHQQAAALGVSNGTPGEDGFHFWHWRRWPSLWSTMCVSPWWHLVIVLQALWLLAFEVAALVTRADSTSYQISRAGFMLVCVVSPVCVLRCSTRARCAVSGASTRGAFLRYCAIGLGTNFSLFVAAVVIDAMFRPGAVLIVADTVASFTLVPSLVFPMTVLAFELKRTTTQLHEIGARLVKDTPRPQADTVIRDYLAVRRNTDAVNKDLSTPTALLFFGAIVFNLSSMYATFFQHGAVDNSDGNRAYRTAYAVLYACMLLTVSLIALVPMLGLDDAAQRLLSAVSGQYALEVTDALRVRFCIIDVPCRFMFWFAPVTPTWVLWQLFVSIATVLVSVVRIQQL